MEILQDFNLVGETGIEDWKLKIEDLWKSLRSVVFIQVSLDRSALRGAGLLDRYWPEAEGEPSIFNWQSSIIRIAP